MASALNKRVILKLAPVSAVVLLRRNGAALFQHRDNKPGINRPDMWVIPGGHQNDGESIRACAVREFEEETGYRCGDLNFLTSLIDYDELRCDHYELNVFWAFYDEAQPLQCREGQDLKFLLRSEAEKLKIPACILALWDQAVAVAFPLKSAV